MKLWQSPGGAPRCVLDPQRKIERSHKRKKKRQQCCQESRVETEKFADADALVEKERAVLPTSHSTVTAEPPPTSSPTHTHTHTTHPGAQPNANFPPPPPPPPLISLFGTTARPSPLLSQSHTSLSISSISSTALPPSISFDTRERGGYNQSHPQFSLLLPRPAHSHPFN